MQLPEAFRSLPRPSSQPSAKASAVNPYTLDLPSMNYIDVPTTPQSLHKLWQSWISDHLRELFVSSLTPFLLTCLALKLHMVLKTLRITLLFSLFNCQRYSSVLELNSKATRASQLNSTPSSHPRFPAGTLGSNLDLVGLGGFEPPTSRLSGVRSNQTEL